MSITKELREKIVCDPCLLEFFDTTADLIDLRHEKELQEARKGWIELPKDKNGAALDPKDQPLMTPGGLSISWSVEYDNEEWFLYAQISTNGIKPAIEWEERRFKPSECELVKAPYGKTGRTIEEGMWIVKEPFPAWEITAVREEEGYPGIWHLFRKNKDGNDVFLYAWCSGNANLFEIVPEPDTQEKIDADALLNPREYFEKYHPMPKSDRLRAQKLDLLRRQRVLDGVE